VEENQSPEAAFAEFENRIARSRSLSKSFGLRRIPRGNALRFMIVISLLLWAGIVLALVHFFA
jgi:hypothetical protein